MPERLSLLQRHIARHSSLATLFRQPAGLSSPQAFTPSGPAAQPDQAESSPVKARLLPEDSQLPAAILLPRLPVPSQLEAYPQEAPIQAAPAEAAAAPAQTAEQTAGPGPTGLQPARVEPDWPQPVAQPSSPEAEDRNWRRLETIFHRHQERQQAESARQTGEPASGPSEPHARPTPGLQGTQTIQTAPASTAEPASPAPERRSPPGPAQTQARVPSEDQQAPPGPPSRREIPTSSIQRQLSQPTPSSQVPADASSAERRPPEVAETRLPEGSEATGQEQPEQPGPSRPQQTVPLEAAWPVERASQPAPTHQLESQTRDDQAAAHLAMPARITTSPAASEPDQTTREASLEHLQRAAPGQPSASSIEVLPPRRPRPVRPPDASPEQEAHLSRPASDLPNSQAGPQPAIQAKREASAPELPAAQPGSPASLQAGPGLGPEAAESSAMQTSQVSDAQPSRPAPERQVPTEIGPLPEDLWRLLGEEPPPADDDTAPLSPPPAASPAPQPGAEFSQPAGSLTGQPPAIQRAIAAAESPPEDSSRRAAADQGEPAAPPAPGMFQDVLPPIQRRAAPGGPSRSTASSQEPGEARPAEADELDLDALARQVYGQIRRRLDLEFERLHRRR